MIHTMNLTTVMIPSSPLISLVDEIDQMISVTLIHPSKNAVAICCLCKLNQRKLNMIRFSLTILFDPWTEHYSLKLAIDW